MKEMIWKTKDNKLVAVSEMTDSHLENAINYLKRTCYGVFETIPDFNEMDRNVEISRREELTIKGYFKLLAEKRRRELKNKTSPSLIG